MNKFGCIMIAILLLAGCESSTNSSARQRQDNALRDPMNYSPNVSEHNDISGGAMTDLKKDSLKKDINSVFNP
jgi:uncharacterized protein YcfL